MSAATSTSSSTCCLIASTSGPVATPSATSRLENVGMGSRFDSSSRSLGGLYSTSSSESEWRSEEHTSELQSQSNIVCRLLLEKKKRGHSLRTTTGVLTDTLKLT